MGFITDIGTITTSVGKMAELIRTARDTVDNATSASLPNFAKSCSLLHRVYIQNEVAGEDILYDTLYNTQSMIAAWALCALQLNVSVDNARTVKKLMDTVATEGFDCKPMRDMIDTLMLKYPGMINTGLEQNNLMRSFESRDPYYGVTESGILYEIMSNKKIMQLDKSIMGVRYEQGIEWEEMPSAPDFSMLTGFERSNVDDYVDDVMDELKANSNRANATSSGSNIMKIPTEVAIPQGRILNVDFTIAQGVKHQVAMWLQLMPALVPATVMEQFIALNFKPSWLQRWLRYSAKEISFLKDFIGQSDRLAERRKALKQDKSGVLADMLGYQDNAVSSHWGKIAQFRPGRQNIATAVLVYDRDYFDRFCIKSNCKFERYADRKRFFDSTYAMMVIVIDGQYNTVDFYYNGIEPKGTYSFKDMKAQAKSDKIGLMDLMQAMSRNQAPRF